MSADIFVTFSVPGVHQWRKATGARKYLAHVHRHLFRFRVEVIGMKHDDRDIEFHDLIALSTGLIDRWYPAAMDAATKDFGTESCEAIARALCEQLQNVYQGRHIRVTVSEDGECGATVSSQ